MVSDFVSGTKIAVSTMAARQIGRLIQNTARQLISSIRKPPTTGPSAIEIPTTAPQKPSARARSTRPVKTCEMMDSATGFSIDPPMRLQQTARAISVSMFGATLHSSEPSEKTIRPIWKTRRRPNRSPVAPDSISSEASTRV